MNMNMNQMSSAVQQAIYDNNEGTRLLRQCYYDEAVKSFTSVLQILKPLAVIVEEKQKHAAAARNNTTRHHSSCYEGNDNDDNSSSSNSNLPFNISFNHTKPTDDDDTYDENDSTIAHRVHTSSSPSRTSVSSSPVDASSSLPSPSATNEFPQQQQRQRKLKHFVFRDPVSIPTPSNIYSEDPPSSYYSPALFSKFLMIVMYNLALTLHLQALSMVSSISTSTSTVSSNHQHQTHKSNVKQLFKRSRKLYEIVFELHLETDVDPLLTLALTNNLGLIYRTVNERKKCLICFQNMFSTMMYLIDAHNSPTNSQSVYEPASGSSSIQSSIKNWDGFLSNAMDILFKHTYEVAAAAA